MATFALIFGANTAAHGFAGLREAPGELHEAAEMQFVGRWSGLRVETMKRRLPVGVWGTQGSW